jgi:hypothetical protein
MLSSTEIHSSLQGAQRPGNPPKQFPLVTTATKSKLAVFEQFLKTNLIFGFRIRHNISVVKVSFKN